LRGTTLLTPWDDSERAGVEMVGFAFHRAHARRILDDKNLRLPKIEWFVTETGRPGLECAGYVVV